MSFDQTSFCKKNSNLLNNWKFYNTLMFLIMQESNTIMKLWFFCKIMENLITMHSQYSTKAEKNSYLRGLFLITFGKIQIYDWSYQ